MLEMRVGYCLLGASSSYGNLILSIHSAFHRCFVCKNGILRKCILPLEKVSFLSVKNTSYGASIAMQWIELPAYTGFLLGTSLYPSHYFTSSPTSCWCTWKSCGGGTSAQALPDEASGLVQPPLLCP